MSRSRKKVPYAGDEGTKFMKKVFNRKLRRRPIGEDDIGGKSNIHRKENDSWDIVDFCSLGYTYEQALARAYELHEMYPSYYPEVDEKAVYRKWYTDNMRK